MDERDRDPVKFRPQARDTCRHIPPYLIATQDLKLVLPPSVSLSLVLVHQFVAIGSRELYPLWALSTVASGGLDWSSKQIGQVRCSGLTRV